MRKNKKNEKEREKNSQKTLHIKKHYISLTRNWNSTTKKYNISFQSIFHLYLINMQVSKRYLT